jgi:hypothetical protein
MPAAAKPPTIVYAKPPRPRRQVAPEARQSLPSVVSARKPGRGPKLVIPPPADDPEATARVCASLSRVIRPPD